jgi:hypothetical protein
MPDDWTLDRLISFAMGLGTFESLDPATIQELGEGLAFLTQEQAALETRYRAIIASQTDTINTQAVTIAMQAATIARQSAALQQLRPGVLLLDEEEDAP